LGEAEGKNMSEAANLALLDQDRVDRDVIDDFLLA